MMKNITKVLLIIMGCVGLAACASQKKDNTYQRKIYLTEKDYMDDLEQVAQAERREAKPNTESNYIFDVQPDTQKNVYFFDYRTRPMVPGEPAEWEYKKTKRLWQKPRRYSPAQYYGNQPTETTSDNSSGYNDYDY